jgi:tetratricopeptide (TPR) repeat protein
VDCFTELQALAGDFGYRRADAYAFGGRGVIYLYRGEYDLALAFLAKQEAIARETGDRWSVSRATANRGSLHCIRGELEQAMAYALECETFSREMGDQVQEGIAASLRGDVLSARGDYEHALACYAEAESIARRTRDRRGSIAALGGRGLVLGLRGDYDGAMACFDEQESSAREAGIRRSIAIAVGNRGGVALSRGEFGPALACMAEQETIARAIGDRPTLRSCLASTARALLECSQLNPEEQIGCVQLAPGRPWRNRCLEAARHKADEARSIAKDIDIAGGVCAEELLLARIEAAENEHRAARDRLLDVLSVATDDRYRAEPHYWLWKLQLDPTVDHRAEAERLFAELYSRIPRHDYKLKLDELRAAAPATTSSTTPTEVRDAVTE